MVRDWCLSLDAVRCKIPAMIQYQPASKHLMHNNGFSEHFTVASERRNTRKSLLKGLIGLSPKKNESPHQLELLSSVNKILFTTKKHRIHREASKKEPKAPPANWIEVYMISLLMHYYIFLLNFFYVAIIINNHKTAIYFKTHYVFQTNFGSQFSIHLSINIVPLYEGSSKNFLTVIF